MITQPMADPQNTESITPWGDEDFSDDRIDGDLEEWTAEQELAKTREFGGPEDVAIVEAISHGQYVWPDDTFLGEINVAARTQLGLPVAAPVLSTSPKPNDVLTMKTGRQYRIEKIRGNCIVVVGHGGTTGSRLIPIEGLERMETNGLWQFKEGKERALANYPRA